MTNGTIDLAAAREKVHTDEIAAVVAQIPDDMDKAARFGRDSGALGFLALVVMPNGEVTQFSNTQIVNSYHMIGALEVAKARMLK